MDHLLIHAALDDFTAPLLLFILIGFGVAAILVMRFFAPRWSTRLLWTGAAVVLLLAIDSVLTHTIPELGDLKEESRLVVDRGSADVLRARRDPVFVLLTAYRDTTTRHPLMIMDDPDGEAERWARYYLYPHRVVSADLDVVQRELAVNARDSRFILSRGAPAVPADVQVDIAERHDEWLLLHVRRR